jgi:hypothetical protein
LVCLFAGARLDARSDGYEVRPWYIVRTDNKRRARLNCISHILAQIPYKKIAKDKVKLPKRSTKDKYDDQASLKGRKFVSEYY